MRTIRLLTVDELPAALDMIGLSYPGMDLHLHREDVQKRLVELMSHSESCSFFGMVDNSKIIGHSIHYRYTMNYHGRMIPVTGIGMVATELSRKKEHVARDLLQHYIISSREQNAVFATLYPFRPDFYHRMGFGFGAQISVYQMKPAQLPLRKDVRKAETLTLADLPQIKECYHRVAERQHGMYLRDDLQWSRYTRSPALFFFGTRKGRKINGYAICSFRKGKDFLENSLCIREIVYEDPQAFYGIMAFLHTQADQVANVQLPLFDADFGFVTPDPRYRPEELLPPQHDQTSVSGFGLMYRSVNCPEAVLRHTWPGVSGTVRFAVDDDFLPGNGGDFLVRFENGEPILMTQGKADAVVKLGIQNFSSLLTGSLSLKAIRAYDLGSISGKVSLVDGLFAAQEKPVCWSMF